MVTEWRTRLRNTLRADRVRYPRHGSTCYRLFGWLGRRFSLQVYMYVVDK